MLWEDLRYVLELATSRSLPEASERLGVSRSTITRRLRDLQNEAGVTIFTRDRHRYRLTEAGLALIDDLHAVNAKIRRLEHKLQSGRKGSRGRLRIGFSNPVLTVPLMRLLTVFRERCPNVALRIHADASSLRADPEVLDLLVEHRAAGSCERKSEQLFDFSWHSTTRRIGRARTRKDEVGSDGCKTPSRARGDGSTSRFPRARTRSMSILSRPAFYPRCRVSDGRCFHASSGKMTGRCDGWAMS